MKANHGFPFPSNVNLTKLTRFVIRCQHLGAGEELCSIKACGDSSVMYRPVDSILTDVNQIVSCIAVLKTKCITPHDSSLCMTVEVPIINELRPNPPSNPDPKKMEVELRGPPGQDFLGWITSLENDDINDNLGRIDEVEKVSGTFNDRGILVYTMDDIRNPSFTIVLSSEAPGEEESKMNVDRNGQVLNSHRFGHIYDAVGVPDGAEHEDLLFGENLSGVNLKYIGKQPTLIFRDSCSGEWYAIGRRNGVPFKVFDKFATQLKENEFNTENVLYPTFGKTNPTRHEKPPPCTQVASPIINEFRPNHPLNPDPSMMTIELRGKPGDSIDGFITSLENDNVNKIGRINNVEVARGTFDADGILTFDIPDIHNPSITVILSSAKAGKKEEGLSIDANGHIARRDLFGTIYDAVGVPDDHFDEILLFAENLGGANLRYIGKQPTSIFRDSCTTEWYAVGRKQGIPHNIYDRAGRLLDENEFNVPNVLLPTFGLTNPTRRSSSRSLMPM